MDSAIIFSLLIVAATAASVANINGVALTNSKDAHVIKYDNDNDDYGGYNFAFETSDGIAREETAEIRQPGTELESLAVHGSYSFVADDGTHYVVKYIADENGFQPQGDHIPLS